jgi:uncharacterized protein DUF1344
MRRFIISSTVIAFVGVCATAALAKTITGTVQSVNEKTDSITLSSGGTFTLPEGIEAETLKPGEKVVVIYTVKKGKMAVSAIRPAQ